MTSKEFCIWLKGVVVASHHWNLTPKSWEAIRNELELVDDSEKAENKVATTQINSIAPKWLGRDITNNPYYDNSPTTTSIVNKQKQLND